MYHICCTANCMSRGSVLHTCPPSCPHCLMKQQQVLCLSCATPTDGIDVCAACAVPPCGPDCACDDCDTHSTSCGPCCECLDCRDDDDSATTTPTYDDVSCPSCDAVIDGIHGSGPYCGRVCYFNHR
jgi:hypothetical protein